MTPFRWSLDAPWQPRREPLEASAVMAEGSVARALATRAMADPDALATLTAVTTDDVLLLRGPLEALPWVDGVVYLGRDPAAPRLLLPTTQTPPVPLELLDHAVANKLPDAWKGVPVAVMPERKRLIPAGFARAVDPTRLQAWSPA